MKDYLVQDKLHVSMRLWIELRERKMETVRSCITFYTFAGELME